MMLAKSPFLIQTAKVESCCIEGMELYDAIVSRCQLSDICSMASSIYYQIKYSQAFPERNRIKCAVLQEKSEVYSQRHNKPSIEQQNNDCRAMSGFTRLTLHKKCHDAMVLYSIAQ